MVTTLEEKRNNFNHFMRSERFTLTTFSYLNLLSHNIGLIAKLIRFELGKCAEGSSEFDESASVMKHLLNLDAVSKLMMMLETLFGLALALLGQYKDVPRKMMSYDQRNIDRIVTKFLKGQVTSEQIWRIIGLPDLNRLDLTLAEQQIVSKILAKSAKDLQDYFRTLAQFYVDHKSTYNRFKHGFTTIAGFESPDDQIGIAMVLDKKTRMQARLFRATEGIVMEGFDWFNVINLVAQSQETFNYLRRVLDLVTSMYLHIIRNHLAYAYNLGEDYLPQEIISKDGISEADLGPAREIVERLQGNMYYIEKPIFKVILNFEGEKFVRLRRALAENGMAVLFVLTVDDVKKSVEHYRRKRNIFDDKTALTILNKLHEAGIGGEALSLKIEELMGYIQKSTMIDEEARDDLLLKLGCFREEPFRFEGKLDIEHKTPPLRAQG